MLALTSALAAACFVRAFGLTFLALPRSAAASEAHESPALMLVPTGVLAALCVVLGLSPGLVLRALEGVTASLPGLQPPTAMGWEGLGMSSADVVRSCQARNLWSRASGRIDRVCGAHPATWGVRQGGPNMGMRRCIDAAHGVHRHRILETAIDDLWSRLQTDATGRCRNGGVAVLVHEVRYRAQIEPTFERYLYGPLVRGIVRTASGMKVLQAGSLHAIWYVLVLAVILLMWLGGTP